jgi:hypothetical protein
MKQMKKYYHMSPLSRVRSISNSGLIPRNEDNSRTINDKKEKVFFSEGMTGAVALYASFQKKYDNIKAGKIEKVPQDILEKIQASKNIEEYMGEGVYFIFDGTEIENENNFMDGYTSQTISPEQLQVCLLKNNDTNEVSYSRFDIINYMMAKVPAESIHYSGKDIEQEKIEKVTLDIQNNVKQYTESHAQEIKKYQFGNYTIENMPVREFCSEYLSQKDSKLTGQYIGKVLEKELQKALELQQCEQGLDILVSRSRTEPEQEIGKETEKIRVKKDNQ